MKLSNLWKLATIATVLTGTAFAQSSGSSMSTASIGDFYQKLKESPLDMSFYLAAENIKDSETGKDVAGILHTDIVYLSYKLTANDRISTENRWTFKNANGPDNTEVTWARSVLKYTRSNILTEERNGVNLSAAIERRQYPNLAMRDRINISALNRASVTASKSFGKFSSANTLYYGMNEVRNEAKTTTAESYWYLLATQAYDLGNDYSISLTEEFIADQNAQDSAEGRFVGLTLEGAKQLTPSVTAALAVLTTPISSKDEWKFDRTWTEELTVAASLFIRAF